MMLHAERPAHVRAGAKQAHRAVLLGAVGVDPVFCFVGFHSPANSRARWICAGVILTAISSRLFGAVEFPWIAARLYDLYAATKSLVTPQPNWYISPSRNCAVGCPWSAAIQCLLVSARIRCEDVGQLRRFPSGKVSCVSSLHCRFGLHPGASLAQASMKKATTRRGQIDPRLTPGGISDP